MNGVKDYLNGVISSKDYFLIDQISKFKEENPNFKLGLATITGSDCYGFRSPNSDYDIRGVFYYNTEEQLKLFNDKKYTFNYDVVNHNDVVKTKCVGTYFVETEYRKYDFVFTEVNNFLTHINRMNCTTLEQLFSPLPIYCTKHFAKLKKIVSQNLASKGLYNSYHGMALFNYKHYIESGRKTTIKKWLYVIRSYLAGIHALENGSIEQDINKLIQTSSVLTGNKASMLKDLVKMKQNNEEDKVAEEVEEYNLHEDLLDLRAYLETCMIGIYDECKLPENTTDLLKEYLDYWLVDLRDST